LAVSENVLQPSGVRRPLNAFTVDLEDWYQSSVDFDAPISDRVVRNTERLLALLDDCAVKATFFVQGLVAEAFPELVQRLADEGHEIQSHGHSHRPLFNMNTDELRAELQRGRATVEDACGTRLTMFRAADFSILRENLWALEMIAEAGFEVDSSIFPKRSGRYGISDWSLEPRLLTLSNGMRLLEAPVSVLGRGRWRVPVAGGGYFRVLPLAVLERALRSIEAGRRPAIVYCHPYEFNTDEIGEFRGDVSRRFRLSQGLGRSRLERRVRGLLTRMSFGRLDEVLRTWDLA
jgi:polysaccharide deacetylase family protein (PEP-CTERM system associated)